MAITPTVSIAENTISMSVTYIHLLLVKQVSGKKEYYGSYNAYPQGLQRDFIRYKITYNSESQYNFTYIVTKLGKIVYLFLIHSINCFSNIKGNVCAISQMRYKQLINYDFF